MPFFCHLSTKDDTVLAVQECLERARAEFTSPVDVALVFFSPHHRGGASGMADSLRQALSPRCLLGCQGETVIGNEWEIENQPSLCVWLGHWGEEVSLTPFHLYAEPTPEGFSILGYPDALADTTPDDSLLLTLADPYTFPVDHFLGYVNGDRPGLRIVGGMASGAHGPGESPLILDDRVLEQGAVGVLLRGPLKARSVVSQGCRPIGRPLVVTKAKENVILELGGQPPLTYLQGLWEALPPRDQELIRQGLHVGRVINEYQDKFQRGDFLIRNVTASDRASGALQITDRVRAGQTVQFHLRDALTADEDLRFLLQEDRARNGKPSGALLFSCNGRGTRLFERPHHDADAVQVEMGGVPLAGFFAQGELGPVGGQNFIHGFTASVLLFA